jgi:hypothetical protein
MTLYEKILEIYPELSFQDFGPRGTIVLINNNDGGETFIGSWNHPTLPKPTEEQLATLQQ